MTIYPSFKALPGASYTGGAGFKMARTKGGVWLPVAANEPGETDAGLGVWEARTSKNANRNGAPVDLAGVTKGGEAAATLTLVDDTAALRAAGFGRLIDDGRMNGQVYKLDNSLGVSVSFVTFTGFTGNTNRHTGVIYLRGTGVGSQLRSTGAGSEGLTNYSLSPSYARIAVDLNALADSRQLQLWVAAGSVVYFILNELKEGPDINDPPIITAGLPATRTADALSFSVVLPPDGFEVECVYTHPQAPTNNPRPFELHNGTDNERILAEWAADVLRVFVTVGGVTTQIGLKAAMAGAREIRLLVRYQGGKWTTYIDDVLSGSVNLSVPAITGGILGTRRNLSAAAYLNGLIKFFVVRSL